MVGQPIRECGIGHVRCERVHSREVVLLETGMLVENFFLGHAVG
jgi:hypothetical protein